MIYSEELQSGQSLADESVCDVRLKSAQVGILRGPIENKELNDFISQLLLFIGICSNTFNCAYFESTIILSPARS